MITLLHILRIALLFLSAIFLSSTFTWAQNNPLELIEGSDDIRLDGKKSLYIVRGNVRLVKDNTKMYCDSAFYHTKSRSVRAYGRVHINKDDSLNMYCDSLYYELDNEFAKLWGNVRVRDLEYKLETDSLDFYGQDNIGVYRKNGVITSIVSPEKLTSKVGYFYTDINHFFFRGDVVYTNEDYKITTDTLKYNGQRKIAHFFGPTHVTGPDGLMYCEKGWYNMEEERGVFEQNAYIDREKEYVEGDSLYYNGLDGIYLAKHNVLIRDTSNSVEFTGDFAKSFEKDRFGFITGHALAKNYDEKGDTLYIHADTLFNYIDTLNDTRLVKAYYGVKIFKLDMQGVCDSMTYDRETGEMNMYYDPVLWAKNAQLTADSITAYERDNDIKRAFLRMNALIVTEVDTGKYYNQITGKTLNAYFDSTQIRRVDIYGNAQTVYFMEDEKDEDTVVVVERSGMNRIYSSNISLFFEGGDIYAATYREEPDGKMYPMDQIDKKEEKVEGFKWDNSRRPISWYTMIMTPEERAEWERHEIERKYLLKPNAIVSNTKLSNNQLVRADDWMTRYANENAQFLRDSIFDDNDSLIPFERWEDIRLKNIQLNAMYQTILCEVQLLQFNVLKDSSLLDSIVSTRELLEIMETENTKEDSLLLIMDTSSVSTLNHGLNNWIDSIYAVVDTLVERKHVQNYLKKQELKALKEQKEKEEAELKRVGVDERLYHLDSLLYDTLKVSFDSLQLYLLQVQEENLELENTLTTGDSLAFAEQIIADSMMTDSLGTIVDEIAAMDTMSLFTEATDTLLLDFWENRDIQSGLDTVKITKRHKNMARIETMWNEIEKTLQDSLVFSSIEEHVLFIERLKIDIKNIHRQALLFCTQELQQRMILWSIEQSLEESLSEELSDEELIEALNDEEDSDDEEEADEKEEEEVKDQGKRRRKKADN